jgi:predicted dehydrogenase
METPSPAKERMPSYPAQEASRLILVGVGGYGAVHAQRIATLQADGAVRLVGAVDPIRDEPPATIAGTPMYSRLEDALASAGQVDVVVVAAPIAEHARLAELALTSGADVLLEKPPVAAFDDFTRLLDVEQRTGRVVQVGFQSLGSQGLQLLREDSFGIGEIRRVTAMGAWSRSVGYWSRSPWAGRRSLRGQPVVDGVVTNPLAHATATALAVIGCRKADDVAAVETDLYRANAIDSDDTSVVRIRTTNDLTVTCAFTLCASKEQEPVVHVHGSAGRVRYAYTADRVDVEIDGQTRTVTVGREDLLENLLAFRRGESELLVPLASTGAFMRVLDAVATAGEPVRVDPRAVSWVGEGQDRRAVIVDVEQSLRQAVEAGKTFTELGLPWAHSGRDTILTAPRIDGPEIFQYRDGGGTISTSTPRPYLHPVRTRHGVVVSATHPADHDWHTGVGMAIPDVNGTNFWGGGTYAPGRGYSLVDDHGVVSGAPVQLEDSGLRQTLDWIGSNGRRELLESRSIRWAAVSPDMWQLTFVTSLAAESRVELASPGSKGRVGGGYGGFFWRLPWCDDVEVFTSTARGERAVHGTASPWVAWSAEFAAGPGTCGPATIVIASDDAASAADPWFVRVDDYPGLGSALAWSRPRVLSPGESLDRRFDILVADGRLDADAVAAALQAGTRTGVLSRSTGLP